jgi:dihydroorotate dehydrogenase
MAPAERPRTFPGRLPQKQDLKHQQPGASNNVENRKHKTYRKLFIFVKFKPAPVYKSLLRPLLFQIDPEKIHTFSYSAIKTAFRIPFVKPLSKKIFNLQHPKLQRQVFGLTFPNPVGLAAGFDKNAQLVDEMEQFGFGFVEIGTVTPRPQPGNDKPRLFRLPQDQGLINRMGFNNQGVEVAATRLKFRKSNIIVGGNIGKNKNTPNEEAIRDYQYCFDALYEQVDYFVVNVSSPNTPDLRALQEKEPLRFLLEALQRRNALKPKRKPVLLKIAPDLNSAQLDDIIEIAVQTKLDGLIATNTTTDRQGRVKDSCRDPPAYWQWRLKRHAPAG